MTRYKVRIASVSLAGLDRAAARRLLAPALVQALQAKITGRASPPLAAPVAPAARALAARITPKVRS
jgi:hypothetical protein